MTEKAGAETFVARQDFANFDGELQAQFVERRRGVKPGVVGMMLDDAAGDGSQNRVRIVDEFGRLPRTQADFAVDDA